MVRRQKSPDLKFDLLKFDLRQARRLLPKRKTSDNKASTGRALVIAGSRGMFGAAVLSATAASRAGAGYVRLMTEAARFPSARHPDFLITDWKKKISEIDFDAAAIGPGLGRSARARVLLRELRRSARETGAVVLDADALRMVADFGWRDLPAAWIMTPHEGELAGLLGLSAKTVRADRRGAVARACRRFGCVVVLKGHRTLVAAPETKPDANADKRLRVFEIQSGNAALAKAGTGDVLTGVILAFLVQGLDPVKAACLGVFVHGCVADDWLRLGRDIISMMASDVVKGLPEALARVRAGTPKPL